MRCRGTGPGSSRARVGTAVPEHSVHGSEDDGSGGGTGSYGARRTFTSFERVTAYRERHRSH